MISAHFSSQLRPVFGRLGKDHPGGTLTLQDGTGGQSDRTSTEYYHVVAGADPPSPLDHRVVCY